MIHKAAGQFIDDVIDPADTRAVISRARSAQRQASGAGAAQTR
jgi:acetyl-CoA carboxylase carboxyltransferase component